MKDKWKTILLTLLFALIFLGIKLYYDPKFEKLSNEFVSITESQIDLWDTLYNYFIYSVISIAIILFTITALFIRWRSIKVFISYNSENQRIAKNIKNAINNYPIEAFHFPIGNKSHDQIIIEVSKMIKMADAVIALPGNRRESNFTDAEIMTASVLKKPLIIIGLKDEQKLPNTAFTGYPQFQFNDDINNLTLAIRYYILIIFNHFKIVNTFGQRALNHSLKYLGWVLSFWLLMDFVFSILGFFDTLIELKFIPYIVGFLLLSVQTIFLSSFAYTVYQQYKLIRISKQKQITGNLTYNELQEIFKYDESRGDIIRKSLLKESLKKRHQV